MARVITLGWACLDQRYWVEAFPPETDRTEVQAYREDLGGPAAVAALTVARLGGEAIYVGRRGADENGATLEARLRDEGVDVRHFRAHEGARTPLSAVLIPPDGRRYIFRYRGEGLPDDGRPARLDAEDLDGATVLVDLRWPTGAHVLIEAARARDCPVIVDFDEDTRDAWDLVGLATHAIADEPIATAVGGEQVLLTQLEAIDTWGAITRGSRGLASHEGDMPAFPVATVDSTGAGDVFHGAFALAIAEGQTEADAQRFASAAAALRCQLADVPTRTQVQRFLEESPCA